MLISHLFRPKQITSACLSVEAYDGKIRSSITDRHRGLVEILGTVKREVRGSSPEGSTIFLSVHVNILYT